MFHFWFPWQHYIRLQTAGSTVLNHNKLTKPRHKTIAALKREYTILPPGCWMRRLWGPFGLQRRVEPPSFSASFGICASLTHLQCSNGKDMEPARRTFYNTATLRIIRKKGNTINSICRYKNACWSKLKAWPYWSNWSLSLPVVTDASLAPDLVTNSSCKRWCTRTNAFQKLRGRVLQAKQ